MATQRKYILAPKRNSSPRVGTLVNKLAVAHTVHYMWFYMLPQNVHLCTGHDPWQAYVYIPVSNKDVLLVLQNVGKKPIELRLP
jgi:hypothetical protein